MKLKPKTTKLRLASLVVFVAALAAVGGFYLGRNNLASSLSTTSNNPNNQYSQEKNDSMQLVLSFYQQLSDEKGEQVGQVESKFDPTKFNFNSPLFKDRQITGYIYSFKGDNIVESSLDLGEGISIQIAEYKPKNAQSRANVISGFPANFATFSGYENYSLSPRYVGPRVMMWDESTRFSAPGGESYSGQQQTYYVESEYLPRQIGAAKLTTYIRFFQGVKKETNPIILSITKTFFPQVSDVKDPIFIDAVNEIKKVAETITFGIPE